MSAHYKIILANWVLNSHCNCNATSENGGKNAPKSALHRGEIIVLRTCQY